MLMPRMIFLMFFVLSQVIVFAQNNDFVVLQNKNEFIEKAKIESDKTNTIVSDFVQEKYLDVLSETIISSGKFHFKKTNSIKWEYTKPFKYLIIIKDDKVMIKDEEKENTIDMKSNKQFKKINEMILKSVQGNIHEDENYDVNFFHNNQFYKVELSPKDAKTKQMIQVIAIHFNKSDYAVESVRLMENSGDYTNITFKNRQINVPIGDEQFKIN
jgi:outer membrane lipoprotein-sorting protein